VRKRITTICCSALALTIALPSLGAAQKPVEELALFPVSVRWSKTLDVNLAAPPAFDETRVIVPLADGRLIAYGLVDGDEAWTIKRDSLPAPVAADGHIFLATDASLVALDAETGGVAWESALDAPLSAPVTAAEGWTFLAGATGVVTALRTSDGSRVWSRDVASPPSHPVSIAPEHVYVPLRDGRVVALNIGAGTIAWERRLGGTPQPVLALDDRLYVGSDNNYFYCLLASDGRVDWRWQTGGDIVGRPAFDDRRVYFVSKDNVIRALDRRSGAQRWWKPLPLRATSGPIAVRNALLVSGLGPSVPGLLMRDGAAAGDFNAGGLLAAPPHVVVTPTAPVPLVVYVTRSLTAAGPTITAAARNVEPAIVPVIPLPNPVPVTPLPIANTTSGDATAPPPLTPPLK
jgi:outer membrane protein assembly factor BamB